MNIIIRHSRDEDAPAMAAIYTASVATETASWEYEAPSIEEFARRRAEVLAKGYPCFAATLDGKVVGWTVCRCSGRWGLGRIPRHAEKYEIRRPGAGWDPAASNFWRYDGPDSSLRRNDERL